MTWAVEVALVAVVGAVVGAIAHLVPLQTLHSVRAVVVTLHLVLCPKHYIKQPDGMNQ